LSRPFPLCCSPGLMLFAPFSHVPPTSFFVRFHISPAFFRTLSTPPPFSGTSPGPLASLALLLVPLLSFVCGEGGPNSLCPDPAPYLHRGPRSDPLRFFFFFPVFFRWPLFFFSTFLTQWTNSFFSSVFSLQASRWSL